MDNELHRLLLRLGGALPPGDLTEARFALAEGDTAAVLNSVIRGLAATRAPISPDDLGRLGALDASGGAADALGTIQRNGSEEPQHVFRPIATDAVEEGVWVPPVVDLTSREWMPQALFADDTDEVAVDAATARPDTVAVWRSWRETTRGFGRGERIRVFLVEVGGEDEDLATRAAVLMATLIDAEEPAPLVEVRSVRDEATPYHLDLRHGAALLWAAEADRPVAIAKTFDGVDPERGPYFAEDHPRLDGEERDRVLRYLETAPVLLSSTERMIDILAPEGGPVVPLVHRTDGRWAWTDTVPYYLRRHGLAPDPALLDAIRAGGYTLPEVTPVGRHRAIAELFMPVDVQPVTA